MRKINWKQLAPGINDYYCANMGLLGLICEVDHSHKVPIWYANVYIKGTKGRVERFGPNRRSLSEAKEDAAKLAEELLLDCHAVIVACMKKFDMEIEDNG